MRLFIIFILLTIELFSQVNFYTEFSKSFENELISNVERENYELNEDYGYTDNYKEYSVEFGKNLNYHLEIGIGYLLGKKYLFFINDKRINIDYHFPFLSIRHRFVNHGRIKVYLGLRYGHGIDSRSSYPYYVKTRDYYSLILGLEYDNIGVTVKKDNYRHLLVGQDSANKFNNISYKFSVYYKFEL